jgi:putative Ca2+/H+ antiporter (TMEM165/GDT1 family)
MRATDTINARSIAENQDMEWKLLLTVFSAVFVAEMADKTQLVTMLFAADQDVSKWTVFLGSAAALVLTSAIGVAAGTLLSQFINVKLMSVVAGAGFMLIGAWTLYHGVFNVQ